MKKISTEQMRYRVPGVRDRFLQVHGRLIVVCAILCLLAITVSLCFVTIRSAYTLEPKTTLIYYGMVEDEEAAHALIQKYYDRLHIILFLYEEPSEQYEIRNSYGQYASYYYTKNQKSTDKYYLGAVFFRNNSRGSVYTVSSEDKATLSTEAFEMFINKVLEEL